MTLYVGIDFDLRYSDAQRHMSSLMLREIRSCAFCEKKEKQEEMILRAWGCRGVSVPQLTTKRCNHHILDLNKAKKV